MNHSELPLIVNVRTVMVRGRKVQIIGEDRFPHVEGKSRLALAQLCIGDNLYNRGHVTANQSIAQMLQTDGAYKKGSWISKTYGDFDTMIVEIFGYVNGDGHEAREVFAIMPNVLQHKNTKRTR